MSQTIVFYHSADMDGHCSGALIQYELRKQGVEPHMYGFDYGNEFPFDLINGETIYMADVSLPIEDMVRVQSLAKEFYWIDHHISAINEALKVGATFKGLQLDGVAACELCLKFFRGQYAYNKTVKWLASYDIWTHNDDPKILAFQEGIKMYHTDPASKESKSMWGILLQDRIPSPEEVILVEEILKSGGILLKYITETNKRRSFALCHLDLFHGYRVLVANTSGVSSKFFDGHEDFEESSIRITYSQNRRGKWRYTIYSDEVDCSKLAKEMGGGGHAGAAGFELDLNIFD